VKLVPAALACVTTLVVAASGSGTETRHLPLIEAVGKLLYVSADGRHWRELAPPRVLGVLGDAVFATPTSAFALSGNCAAARGVIHSTIDAGKTWRARPAPDYPGCHAGAGAALDFLDARHGWLSVWVAEGPVARLYRTADGGRTWRQMSEDLPCCAPVRFRTRSEGWLGGRAFFRSDDRGRTWRAVPLPRPPHTRGMWSVVTRPAFFGLNGVVAATYARHGRGVFAVYSTRNGGRSWSRRATRAIRVMDNPLPFGKIAFDATRPGVWWAVPVGRADANVTVAVRGRVSTHRLALDGRWVVSIQALDASTAVVMGTNGRTFGLSVTSDGGRSWHDIEP
jgi:photosystem II stability/assembly factor-like uncharacterized protein